MKKREPEQDTADRKERESEENQVHRIEREQEQTLAEAEEFRKKGASQDMLSAEEAPRFDREQLLASERYRSRRDLAEALFEKGRQYTIEEAEGLISSYMKGKVV